MLSSIHNNKTLPPTKRNDLYIFPTLLKSSTLISSAQCHPQSSWPRWSFSKTLDHIRRQGLNFSLPLRWRMSSKSTPIVIPSSEIDSKVVSGDACYGRKDFVGITSGFHSTSNGDSSPRISWAQLQYRLLSLAAAGPCSNGELWS
jgi:hypothetical protein